MPGARFGIGEDIMDDTSMIQIESLEFSYEHNLVFQNLSYTFEKGISYAIIYTFICNS